MASLCGSSRVTPFVMPLDSEGKVTLHEHFLSLKFNFIVGTMYVEEEIYNNKGEISQIVFQLKSRIDDGAIWILRSGLFRVFGMSNLQMSTSTILVLLRASTSNFQITLVLWVKIKHLDLPIFTLTELEDDINLVINLEDTSVNPFS